MAADRLTRGNGPCRPLGGMIAAIAIILAAGFVCGCGKPPLLEARGRVRLDGKPLEGCKVGFFPDLERFDPERHGFGFGITDAEGRFVIRHPQGEDGIWAGDYKVTLEAWIDSDGRPVPPDAKPSEVPGGVRNRLPEKYETAGTTPERATIRKGEGNVFEIEVTSTGS